MAIGAILGGVQLASGLLGGGGPRAPRMNSCQKEQFCQQSQQHAHLASHMQHGCQRVCQCSNAFRGQPCSHQFGPYASAGIHGASNFGFGMNQWGNNSMAGLFSPPFGPSFGAGLPFQPPGLNLSIAMGVSMNV